MDRLSRYRKHARDCRDQAERARNDEQRDLLRAMANHWEALADLHKLLAPRKRERT